jgi:hypothetical protein
MVNYSKSSPYYNTSMYKNEFLDIMANRTVPADANDIQWEITPTYHMRPDLLAHDLYSESGLWWVFASRNPNKLKDPLFDFVEGTTIYLPQLPLLQQALGI